LKVRKTERREKKLFKKVAAIDRPTLQF